MSRARARFAARRTTRIAYLLLGMSSWSVAAAQGSAQPAPPSAVAPLEYESEVSQGLSEHERGNFEEARRHFLRAQEVFPNARTLRGLGKVEFELHSYARAAEYLEAALSSPVRPLPPELRDEVQRLLIRARANEAERAALTPDATLSAAPGPRLAERASASRVQQERTSPETPAYRKWWVWTITGAAVAGVVTAVILATRDPEVHTRPVPTGSTVLENP